MPLLFLGYSQQVMEVTITHQQTCQHDAQLMLSRVHIRVAWQDLNHILLFTSINTQLNYEIWGFILMWNNLFVQGLEPT